jgi:dTDP-4-dehydrorhamnose 3,5-epimerase
VSGPAAEFRRQTNGIRPLDTALPGVLLLHAPHFEDDRGWFAELWNAGRYAEAGLDVEFVQHNTSCSHRGVLRGLHFQHPNPQGKLISVLRGTVYDAVVDVRLGSPTFGRWYGCELSAANGLQLWMPPGFAHGFLVLSDEAIVHYACTEVYDAGSDRSMAWDDPDIGIAWPGRPGVVSAKDRAAPRLRDLEHLAASLPAFEPPRRSSE